MADPCATNTNWVWGIGVRHLSWLWSELLPRIAAADWAKIDGDGVAPNPREDIPTLAGADLKPLVANWLEWILGETIGGDPIGTVEFRSRMTALQAYWLADGGDHVPPITFQGSSGYDFMLHEGGMDLWIPQFGKKPRASRLAQLLFLFTMRDPGRPVLGTPGVRAQYIMAASTGASQVLGAKLMTYNLFAQNDGRVRDVRDVMGAKESAVQTVRLIFHPVEMWTEGLDHGADLVHVDVPDERIRASVLEAREELLNDYLEVMRGAFGSDPDFSQFEEQMQHFFERWREAANEGRGDLSAQNGFASAAEGEHKGKWTTDAGSFPFTNKDQKCQLKAGRCWQLEGTVFRAIAEQYPRLVAQVWFDRMDDATGEFPGGAVNFQYRERMKFRLETHLDDTMAMDELTDADVTPAPLAWLRKIAGFDDAWWGTRPDLTVTNLGLHFSESLPPAKEKDADAFLGEILQGRAGNPVFTDSMYST